MKKIISQLKYFKTYTLELFAYYIARDPTKVAMNDKPSRGC